MALSALYTLAAVNCAGTTICGITDDNIETGITLFEIGADGSVNLKHVGVDTVMPVINFTTMEIAKALDVTGMGGAAISSNAVLYLQQCTQDGTRKASTDHVTATIAAGFVQPVSISAPSNGGKATMSVAIHARSTDGSTAPIAYATGATYGLTVSESEGFVAGPVSLNGSALAGVQNTNLDFGVSVGKQTADGEIYPTFLWVQEQKPRITIETLDPTVVNTYGVTGTAQGSSDSVVYLRKVAKNGTRVANATAEHISFTVDDGMIVPTGQSGSHGSPRTGSVDLVPTYDGTAAVIVLDSSVAIS